jgi:hypothetical protein
VDFGIPGNALHVKPSGQLCLFRLWRFGRFFAPVPRIGGFDPEFIRIDPFLLGFPQVGNSQEKMNQIMHQLSTSFLLRRWFLSSYARILLA